MYKALKDAQSDINATLLKLVDDIYGVSESRSVAKPSVTQASVAQTNNVEDTMVDFSNTLKYLSQKQNAQFELLVREISSIKENMENILKFMMTKIEINTDTIIPNLQPNSQESDLNRAFIDISTVDHVSDNNSLEEDEQAQEAQEEAQEEEQEQEQEQEQEEQQQEEEQEEEAPKQKQEASEEAPEEEALEEEAPEQEAPEEEATEEEEDGLEVEEWTYKGRQFFKDSENIVYANNAGEPGDPIGQYDPAKNIVKKLPTN